MNRYFLESRYMVEENEQEIQFYAQTKPQGIIRTALWKYDIGSRELHRCFEIRKRIAIWKYTVDIKESELKYLGISTIGEYYIIGLNDNGDMLFRYELDGTANYPVYDMAGNVYISVNNFWILCLSEKGKLLWKWKPICDHFYGIKGIKKYWIANEKLYVIAYDYLFVITSDGDTEASYIVNDFNDATQYEVQNDKIIFSSENYQELICCNFKAENLWRYGRKLIRVPVGRSKPMKKIDEKIVEIKRLQAELDHRTKVEQEAEKLICQCRFEEANALLATLDDNRLLQQLKEM